MSLNSQLSDDVLASTIYPRGQEDKHAIEFYLAVLNSAMATFFIRKVAFELTKGAFTKVRTNQLGQLPIRTINFSHPSDKSQHDHIVQLVEKMLAAKQDLAIARVDAEKTRLEMLCESLDRQIDDAVYKLYGLTEEEIAVVEGKKL